MMNEFITVPCIVVIAYFIGYAFKTFWPNADKFTPIVCGSVGLILGIVIYITVPDMAIADNWPTAAAIGITSGLAATGANQIYKQFTK